MKFIGRIFLFILFFLSNFQIAKSYVLNINSSGVTKAWGSDSQNLQLFANFQNSSGISQSDFESILSNSINQWNGNSTLNFSQSSSNQGLENSRNDIVFSNDPFFFSSSSVLAVTVNYSNNSSAHFFESDILINDNFSYSTVSGGTRFLGDILTHELGHMIGLDHSQVKGASMFFQLFNGQSTTHTDDLAGMYRLYPNNSKGSISGRIVGGPNASPIFGAHVQAISQKSGKVVASTVSSELGIFRIDGLESSDQYFIYVEELNNLDSISSFYSTVQNKFCSSNTSYRGAFYQSCRSREIGKPQAVLVGSNSNVDVGNITIRCNLDVPTGYLAAQGNSEFELDVNNTQLDMLGNAFTGYFSKPNVGAKDSIRVDLSDYDFSTDFLNDELFLEVKVTSQSYYSKIKYDIDIISSGGTTYNLPTNENFEGVAFDDDNNPTLEIFERIPMTSGLSNNNDFLVELATEDYSAFTNSIVFSNANDASYFPSFSNYGDEELFYFMIINVVKKTGADSFEIIKPKRYDVQSNNTCLDAPLSTSVVANKSIVSESSLATGRKNTTDDGVGVSCGSVDMGSGGGSGGPMNLILGMLLSIILSTWIPGRKVA